MDEESIEEDREEEGKKTPNQQTQTLEWDIQHISNLLSFLKLQILTGSRIARSGVYCSLQELMPEKSLMQFDHFEVVFRSSLNYILIVHVNKTVFLLSHQIY